MRLFSKRSAIIMRETSIHMCRISAIIMREIIGSSHIGPNLSIYLSICHPPQTPSILAKAPISCGRHNRTEL